MDLQQLASGTGGRYLRPQSLLDLILQLRDLEEEFSRNVHYTGSAVARGVTPIVQVDRDTIDCGVYYEFGPIWRRTSSVTITNIGDAPLQLRFEDEIGPDFVIDTVLITGGALPQSPYTHALLPTGSLQVVVDFVGEDPGSYEETLRFDHDGCGAPATDIVTLARVIAAPGQEWRYYQGFVLDDSLYFGSTPCAEPVSLGWTLQNFGDFPNTLRILPPLPVMFSSVPDSIVLQPYQEGWTPMFGFEPTRGGSFGGWMHYESLDKPPFRTAFLVASDATTLDAAPEGTRWRTLVERSLRPYLSRLHGGFPENDNHVAIFGFNAEGVHTALPFTDRLATYPVPMPDTSFADPGDFASAIDHAMDSVAASPIGKRYLFVIVNDANPLSPADATALRERAERDEITLAIAAAGENGYAALASTAGMAGRFDSCYTLEALERFIYETTKDAVVMLRDSMYVTGSATEARLEIEPRELDFGRIRVGGDACLPVTLRNMGDATVRILDVINPAEPFPTSFPDSLAAGDSAVVELCFTVSALGRNDATALFVYEGCAVDTLRVSMTATGYDSVNVGIQGVYRGMPGHVIRIPVQLYGSVPASYGALGYDLKLTYDKTMLYPLEEEIISEGTATKGMRVSGPWPTLTRSFEDGTAIAIYRVMGADAMDSPQATAVLLAPPFLVLHGSAMETPLRVTAFGFLGGNPAAGIAGSGTFIADSLCFQEQRLIDASARYNATLLGGWPNPFNPTATIAFALREAARVRLSVHDRLGREVAVLKDGPCDAGTFRVVFDATGMPTGLYFYRLESGSERLSGTLLYLK